MNEGEGELGLAAVKLQVPKNTLESVVTTMLYWVRGLRIMIHESTAKRGKECHCNAREELSGVQISKSVPRA